MFVAVGGNGVAVSGTGVLVAVGGGGVSVAVGVSVGVGVGVGAATYTVIGTQSKKKSWLLQPWPPQWVVILSRKFASLSS